MAWLGNRKILQYCVLTLNSEEVKAVKYAVLLFLLTIAMPARAQNASREARTPCASGTLNTESSETAKSLSTFLEMIKAVLSSNDKRKLADMSAYPLHVATPTRKFTVRSREEFLRKYEQIFREVWWISSRSNSLSASAE
jgi:hypothetical protein